ncbi:uncharacterized protein knl1 [Oncorhynchus keta]|uniref:uncharacterized protein knl1 n=1 Tax=Oncorhynchus keta TaxID=8018 RepID=UPI0015FD851A|nr:uncharacterized protein knl1 [Oncorhynchus keta]
MEPPDAASRTDDHVGSSKRRISSILKVPRTSIKFTGPELEESRVEVVKPVEKRISRRVSFATSNDVLLFSKDVKNGSPVRSPLTNLTTTAENISIHTGSIEGSQPITGMETLLNAPLHVSQQRNKENVMFNQDDYGEKTMMFTGEDTAFMDMTHSHTILIANDSESVVLPNEMNVTTPTCGSMDFTFSMEKGKTGCFQDSTENYAPFKNPSSLARGIDPEFEHFLASITKSSGPMCNPIAPKSSTTVAFHRAASPPEKTNNRRFLAALNARRSGVDKENQLPALSATGGDCTVGSIIPQRQGPQFMNTSMMQTEQDHMDLTKSHTTLIDGKGVFQCVQTVSSEEQRLRGSTFSQVTVSTDPDEMELTRSQTVAIDSKAIWMFGPNPSQKIERKSVVFTSDPNKSQIFSGDAHGMEITSALNVPLQENVCAPTKKGESSPWMIPPESRTSSVQQNQQTSYPYSDDMEMTRCQTVAIDSKSVALTEIPLLGNTRKSLSFMPASHRGVFFSEDGNGMDLTEALTGNIVSNSHIAINKPLQSLFPTTEMSFHSDLSTNMEMTSGQRSNKVLEPASSDPDDMEITKSLTAVIDSKYCVMEKPSLSKPKTKFDLGLSYVPPSMEYGNFSDNANSVKRALDQVKSFSVAISDPDDMEITRSQTVAIDTKSLNVVNRMQNTRKSISFMSASNRPNHMSEDDCGMDMTKSLTVSIDHRNGLNVTDETTGRLFPISKHQKETFEKSLIRAELSTDDMEITRSKTGIIDTRGFYGVTPSLQGGRGRFVSFLDSNKTLIGEDNNCMEMTQALTAQILTNVSHSAHGGETLARMSTISKTHFTGAKGNHFVEVGHKPDQLWASDSDDMDMTRSQTAVIESENIKMGNRDPFMGRQHLSSVSKTLQMVPSAEQSAHGEITFQLGVESLCSKKAPTSSDSEMELTRSQTVAIESKVINMMFSPETNPPLGNVSISQANDMEVKRVAEATRCRNNPVPVPSNLGEKKMARDETEMFSEDHEMEMTKAVTTQIEQHAPTNVKGPSSTTNAISLCLPEGHPREIGTNLTEHFDLKGLADRNDPDLKDEDCSFIPNNPESSPIASSVSTEDNIPLKKAKTRRMSLADLQLKLNHMSRMINESTEVMGSCTAPLSHLMRTSDQHNVETESFSTVDYGSKTMGLMTERPTSVNLEDHIIHNDKPNMTAPLNLKSKCLASRLSFGGFLPKLPQIAKPSESNQSNNVTDFGKLLKKNSLGGTHELRSNTSMENIDDEVLPDISSEEDLSETVDTKSPQRVDDKGNLFLGKVVKDVVEHEVFKELVLTVTQCQKRPLPEEGHDDSMDEVKRNKPSTENIREMIPHTQVVQWDSNCTGAAADGSSSNSNLRCEGTFESSTYRQSQFESLLDNTGDYTSDVRKKLQDGSITVAEFLKLFSIDFVIHKPRQSILPARIVSDLDRKTEDLLIEKHINRPKQRVYETDCQILTEMVEGLKARLRDQDSLLQSVNGTLWEAVKGFSDEELLLVGSKLKERRTFFRKRSKVRSHEMKAVLYSDLVRTTREAQHNLRGNIEKTDQCLKDLDECLHDLEDELAAVEGTGVEDCEPTLKARQQGLEKVNKAIVKSERQMCELKLQKTNSVDKVDRLRKETLELEKHIAMLDRVNEWKFVQKDDMKTVYSFLYESLLLEVQFEKPNGEVCEQTERNIMDITFQRQMDDEKSQCYSRLVHNLLCQYIGSETTWFKKYPTSRYIPMLLHDVGLVVSRCRLLGEEIHLMKKWGALRLDILDISCVDTQVRILFSSLKSFSKFEMTVAVTSAYPFGLFHVQNFQNHIGNATKDQVEDIVSSVTPAKNYLTKIVKRIHESLLC